LRFVRDARRPQHRLGQAGALATQPDRILVSTPEPDRQVVCKFDDTHIFVFAMGGHYDQFQLEDPL